MKLYIASSWRNPEQPEVVQALRRAGHECYDFRNPAPGNNGFQWSQIDPEWKAWGPLAFREALSDPIAEAGFGHDWNAMLWADAGVLVLPCGRSAHIEAGYFVGAGKPLIILLADGEPELMYKMASALCYTIAEAIQVLAEIGKCQCTSCKIGDRLYQTGPWMVAAGSSDTNLVSKEGA